MSGGPGEVRQQPNEPPEYVVVLRRSRPTSVGVRRRGRKATSGLRPATSDARTYSLGRESPSFVLRNPGPDPLERFAPVAAPRRDDAAFPRPKEKNSSGASAPEESRKSEVATFLRCWKGMGWIVVLTWDRGRTGSLGSSQSKGKGGVPAAVEPSSFRSHLSPR